MNLKALILTAGLAALAPWVATAASDTPRAARAVAAQPAASAAAYSEGEVKKVDLEQGKITLKHSPIENLGMPGMTMVFRADKAVLATVQAGDNVKFKADRVDGAIKVTELVK